MTLRSSWHFEAGDVKAWLDTDHRTPRLVLSWPTVEGWRDEAGYAFEAVLEPRSLARRVVSAYLGPRALASVTEAVLAVRQDAGEEPEAQVRTWSRTIGRGFCPGDLDDVDSVTVLAAGVRAAGYTHSYSDRSGEWSWLVSWADFVQPQCVHRAFCEAFLPRIDPYLRLCMLASAVPVRSST